MSVKDILDKIAIVSAFDPDAEVKKNRFIELKTDQTSGYIPSDHLETYLESGFFALDTHNGQEFLRFSSSERSFKEAALEAVTDALIEKGLIPKANVPKVQRRNIGGADRLNNPEFTVNRAYDGYFGFPLDGIALNVVRRAENGQAEILLQRRGKNVVFGKTLDFAAGGAVVAPQSAMDAILSQTKDEMGMDATKARYSHSVHMQYLRPTENVQTMRLHQRVFTLEVAYDEAPTYHDPNEVDGFQWASPQEIIEYCKNGKFAPSHVLSMMSALAAQGLMPEFEGRQEVEQAIKPFITTAEPQIRPVVIVPRASSARPFKR